MIDQLPAIMVLAPMFGALMIGLFGQKDHRVCFPIVFTSLIISLGAAIGCANLVTKDGTDDVDPEKAEAVLARTKEIESAKV